MKHTNKLARRHFLKAAGGASLALPFLPSLDTRAFGADAQVPKGRFFAALMTEHGGILRPNMLPSEATLTERHPLYPGHEVRHGKLRAKMEGAMKVVSPTLTAPADMLTDRLVSKMNVLHGFDWPFYTGHHDGGHLGNIASNAGNAADIVNLEKMPTIDEITAWSPGFYSSAETASIRARVGVLGSGGGVATRSFGYSNPQQKSGSVVRRGGYRSPSDAFDALVGKISAPSTPGDMGPPPAKPIVDRFLQPYKALANNSRLSSDDKQRLSDWMARLSELQRKLESESTPPPRSAACGTIARPTGGEPYPDEGEVRGRTFMKLMNDVIAAAFLCGSTRIATLGLVNHMTDYKGDWHNAVAHGGDQTWLTAGGKNFFQSGLVDLAYKLDVEYAPGRSLLDDTLIQWSQEAGPYTHECIEMTIVTFGGAGGFFKTGNFVDYSNASAVYRAGTGKGDGQNAGLLVRQWFATVLASMGVARAEWERPGWTGYGVQRVDAYYTRKVASGVVANASAPVPVIT